MCERGGGLEAHGNRGKAERRHRVWGLWLTPARLPPAQLALKHRQGKNHKMRIIAFVGSPVEDHEKDVSPAARVGTGPPSSRSARWRWWVPALGERGPGEVS